MIEKCPNSRPPSEGGEGWGEEGRQLCTRLPLSSTLSPSDGAREKPPADYDPTNNLGMHGSGSQWRVVSTCQKLKFGFLASAANVPPPGLAAHAKAPHLFGLLPATLRKGRSSRMIAT